MTEVRTQAQYNRAYRAGERYFMMKDAEEEITFRGKVRVMVFGNSKAQFHGNSKAWLYDNSKAVLYDNSRAARYDNSRAMLYDNSLAWFCGDSKNTERLGAD